MTFIDRISQDIANAMRAKDTVRLGALRMAKAALMNQEIHKGRPLDEAESQQVVTSLIKQRRDSIEQFRKGGRDDLADKEAAEIGTLETYLPAPLGEDEVAAIIDGAIAAAATDGKSGMAAMGAVMKVVTPQVQGRADGSAVAAAVKARLQG